MSQGKDQSRYSYISYETRLKIINHVYNQGLTIKRTAEILGLKPSTTRMILKRFKEDGVVFERKCERHERIAKGSVAPVLPASEEKVKTEKVNVIYPPPENEAFPQMPYFFIPIGCWPGQTNLFF